MGQGGPGQTLLTPPKPASWSPRGQDRTNYLPNCMVLKAPRSERTLQVSVLVAFASGVVLGWQANRLRRRYLDWRKRRLQDKLATTQKKLDLA